MLAAPSPVPSHRSDHNGSGAFSPLRRSVSELSSRLDVAVVQRERALQHTQGNMMDAARVLASECERVQRECDDERGKARKARLDHENLLLRHQAILKEVNELQKRNDDYQSELQRLDAPDESYATKHSVAAALVVSNAGRRAEQSSLSASSFTGGSNNHTADLSLAEYAFLVSRLQLEVNAEEMSVTSLKQRHQDVYAQQKSLAAEVDRLREDVMKMELQRRHLQDEQLVLAAANANPAHREAVSIATKYSSLDAEISAKREELRQARLENSTLTSHLLSGWDQRSQAINALRKNLLTQQSVQQHEDSGKRVELCQSHFASDLLKENIMRRADFAAVVLSCDQEKDALRQFINVLSNRVDDAMHRHFLATKKQAQSHVTHVSQSSF